MNTILKISNSEVIFQVKAWETQTTEDKTTISVYIERQNYTFDKVASIINSSENYLAEIFNQKEDGKLESVFSWQSKNYISGIEEEFENQSTFLLFFTAKESKFMHQIDKNTTAIEYIAIMSDIDLEMGAE